MPKSSKNALLFAYKLFEYTEFDMQMNVACLKHFLQAERKRA